MDARKAISALILTCVFVPPVWGDSYRTENFIVTARTRQLARYVARVSEQLRRDLAVAWLGKELRPWSAPCPIEVHDGSNLGAGGQTSFAFDAGRPFDWQMMVQGSQQRIIDSVLPHEITHTVFATHFGCPLPRWADEGACTTVEDISERSKQQRLLIEFLENDRGIAFHRMFSMKQYPRDILPLYAQGYSLARFLIQQGGKQKFVNYVGNGMQANNWPAATMTHYGYASLSELQQSWLRWIKTGSPQVAVPLSARPRDLVSRRVSDPRTKPGALLLAPPAELKMIPVELSATPQLLFAPGSTRDVAWTFGSETNSGSAQWPQPARSNGVTIPYLSTSRPQNTATAIQQIHQWDAADLSEKTIRR